MLRGGFGFAILLALAACDAGSVTADAPTWGGLRVEQRGAPLARGRPALILLHGYGAPGDDLVPLVTQLRLEGWSLVLPAAPIELGTGHGGRAWFPLPPDWRERRAQGLDLSSERPDGLAAATRAVERVVHDVASRGASPVVLAGFSQGGMLALHVGVRRSEVDAIAVLSGMAIDRGRWAPRLSQRRGLRAFVSHARDDSLVPFAEGERVRSLLGSGGVRVTWLPFAGGHSIPLRVVGGLRRFARAL